MVKVHDTPSEVVAEAGEVHVDGPAGVAVAFTPSAAAETSNRLLRGAATARDQEPEVERLRAEQEAKNGQNDAGSQAQ